MIICKEIDEYIEYTEAHPNWINEERRLLIKNIVKPFVLRDDIFFDEATYRKCLAYCERNYYPLFPYQKFIYAFVFMYQDNAPVFRKFVIMEGRGNGKDGFIVPLVNFFQTPLYGVANYHIEIVANSEEQAKESYKIAYEMLNKNPKFKGLFTVTKQIITNTATKSDLKFNTCNAPKKDGKRPGCLVFNELHAYENYDQINVFESSLGKVEHPRIFIITTNGYVRDGPLDDTIDSCRKILTTGENLLKWFPFICKWDDKSEVDNREAWHKANPSLEHMPILAAELEQEYIEAKEIPSRWPEFITKRGNCPAQKEEQAVTSWENILRACYSDIERKIPRVSTQSNTIPLAVIGIDYADIRDFASAGVLTKDDDGNFVWRQHTWISANSPFLSGIKFPFANQGQSEFDDFEIVPESEPVIPVEAIVKWCEKQMESYRVMKITMDTYRYTLFKEIFLRHDISLETKANPNGLVRLLRHISAVTGIIAPSIENYFSLGKINFGQSAIMRWYTNNTCTVMDKHGNYTYGKIEPIRRKNDGFMAFVAAMYSADLLKEVIIYV